MMPSTQFILMHNKALLIFVSCFAMTSCGPRIRELPKFVKFVGQAQKADGSPLSNAMITLQPIESGYEIEMETDARGQFSGEGAPGKYVYYFTRSPKSKSADFSKAVPADYQEPKMEHLVTVSDDSKVVCKIE